MFYTYLRGLVAFILWVLNGNAHYHHKDNIPDRKENYILVSPHRTWWDPVKIREQKPLSILSIC